MSNGSEKTAIAYAMIVIQKILPSSNSIHHRMSKLSIKPTIITTKEKAHSIYILQLTFKMFTSSELELLQLKKISSMWTLVDAEKILFLK